MFRPSFSSKAARAFCLIALALLTSCSEEEQQEEAVKDSDPLTMRALNDPLMIDYDLESQTMDDSAFGFEVGKPVPALVEDSEIIIKAQQEAVSLVGNNIDASMLPSASGSTDIGEAHALGALGRISRLSPSGGCMKQAGLSNAWAAKMPPELALYPYGNINEGLGAEGSSCVLRSVVYHSFTPMNEILAFHYAMTKKAGYQTEVLSAGDWKVLHGTKGSKTFEITARVKKGNLNEIGIAYLATSR